MRANVAVSSVHVYKYTGVNSDTPEVSNLTPQTATITRREPHGMVPGSVIHDHELSDKAVRAYGALALKGHGAREVEMDYPEMRAHLKTSESTAKRAVAELVRRNHVSVSRRHNSANVYQFTSSVFGEGAALLAVGVG